MTKKRILLIHGDRLLRQLFQEALELDGFAVDVRNTLGDAHSILEERKPAAILLDLVHEQGRAVNFVKLIRAEPSTEKIPVLILPSALQELANAAVASGATLVIEPGDNVLVSTVTAVRNSVGILYPSDPETLATFRAGQTWADLVFAEASRIINQMRHCLPALVFPPSVPPELRTLWHLAHSFAQRALFVPDKLLVHFLEGLDMLLHDLNAAPDQVNPSTIRTIGHAIDFLAKIAQPEKLHRLAKPESLRILVVDDEPGALQFISAALHLAGLEAETADTPAACLEKVGGTRWDLIFLDIGLPGSDGFQLCTQIRADEKHKTTPIVFITGMANFNNKATACLSGGNDFVGKPFNICELGVKALTWLYSGQLRML